VTGNVLVVDDDRQMVRTLCDVLQRRGFQPHGVHSGEEAVAAVDKEPWTAVLMDIRMPGMSGVAACRAMRVGHPDLRVILMTAYSSPEVLADAAAAGVEQVLPKPLQLPVLFERLAAQGGP